MEKRKSVPTKPIERWEHVIQNRLREVFPYTQEQVASFGDWIDGQLLLLEVEFSAFVTHRSTQRSLSR